MAFIEPSARRWFQDRKYDGRYLEVAYVHEGETEPDQTVLVCYPRWAYGRPPGAQYRVEFRLSSLLHEKIRGVRRFHELEGVELARAREQGVR